jgi:subtilisin family serine protease/sugar lactone lactonase YvrE
MIYPNTSTETADSVGVPRGPAARGRGATWARLLSALLLLLTAFMPARGQSSVSPLPPTETQGPRAVDDLAVVPKTSGGYRVFVVDKKQRAIYYGDVAPGVGVTVVDWASLKRLALKGEHAPRNPSALAAHENTLYVADYKDEEVFAVSLAEDGGKLTGSSRLLVKEPRVRKPMSLDVSPEGVLAIGQDDVEVLLLDIAAPEGALVKLPGLIDEPGRLQFVPAAEPSGRSNLLVLDSENEQDESLDTAIGHMVLYEYREPTMKGSEPGQYVGTTLRLPSEANSRLKTKKDTDLDVAYVGGCLYLTDAKTWLGYSSSEPLGVHWLLTPPSARYPLFERINEVTPTRLRASGDTLFISDSNRRAVWALSLKPVTVRIDASAPEANEVAADFYSTLQAAGYLPQREYNVALGGRSEVLVSILKAEKVLATAYGLSPRGGDIPPQLRVPPAAKLLGNLLCAINSEEYKWKCDAGPGVFNQSGATSLFYRPGGGNAFAIPALGLESVPGRSSVVLQGRTTLRAEIERRLKGTDALLQISTRLLMDLSQDYYRTLERELTRDGYVLVSRPTATGPAIRPGTLLTLSTDQEQPAAAPDCPANWPGLESGVKADTLKALGQPLRLAEVRAEYLPRRAATARERAPDDRTIQAEMGKRGTAKIEVVFDEPVEERAPRLALANPAPACWPALAGPRTYLALDVVKVSGMKYRLRRADDTTIPLTQEEINRWGLDGVPDETGEWSVIVPAPYTLGYRALRWDGQPLFSATPEPAKLESLVEEKVVADPHLIKPKSGQDIWARTTGTFFFPSYRWEIRLQADAALAAGGAPIRTWADKFKYKVTIVEPGARPTSTEQTAPAPFAPPAAPAVSTEDVAANRRALLKAIDFPALPPEATDDITIGLMEKEGSIELTHSDFAWEPVGGASCADKQGTCYELIWQRPPMEGEAQGERMRTVVDRAAPRRVFSAEEIAPIYPDFWRESHGTHIAGLLASTNPEVPGLLPNAQVRYFEIDGTNPNLSDQLGKLLGNSLQVFNVSQHFKDVFFPKSKLQDQSDVLGNILYVVAAGDGLPAPPESVEGADLNSTRRAEVPAPVAWQPETQNLLVVGAVDMNRKLVKRPDTGYRFNYGSSYVHVVAPGFDIYSSTKNNSYALASGTSQAAPLVAAMAALLSKVKSDAHFSLIKGRLIYTADWDGRDLKERTTWPAADTYLWRVWGGSLNASRAYEWRDENVFEFDLGDSPQRIAITLEPTIELPLTITNVTGNDAAYFVEQPKKPGDLLKPTVKTADSKIDFSMVLRLTRLADGTYRIIYLDQNRRMRIIMGAVIAGSLKYHNYKELKDGKWEKHKPVPTNQTELLFSDITDYVARFGAMSKVKKFSSTTSALPITINF